MEIPWTKLGSRPVKVHLEGVCVLVGPVDRNSWGDHEVRERRLRIKRASLEKAEAAAAKKEKDGNGNDEDVQVRVRGFVVRATGRRRTPCSQLLVFASSPRRYLHRQNMRDIHRFPPNDHTRARRITHLLNYNSREHVLRVARLGRKHI